MEEKQTLGDYTTINYMGEVWYNIPEGNIVNGQNTARRVSSNFSQGQGDVYSGYKRVSQVVANLFYFVINFPIQLLAVFEVFSVVLKLTRRSLFYVWTPQLIWGVSHKFSAPILPYTIPQSSISL